jgi:hypothetical protein
MAVGAGGRVMGRAPWFDARSQEPRYIVPPGDERCDTPKDACKCMKRKGHDGLHACAHGEWRATSSQESSDA